jgi:hypothetical protein
MASVTFPVSIGGDGSTVTDDSNTSTGLARGGHRTRFVPALAQVVAIGAYMTPIALNALNAAGTSATSTSSVLIGSGSKSLTLAQTGKAFAVGQWVQITDAAAPSTNYMVGAITAFTAGTGAMTVNVAMVGGSGTLSNWAVHPASPQSIAVLIGSTGSVLLSGAGALGYTTGSGGTVTQLTSRTTGVTLAKTNGSITMFSAAGSTTAASFTVTNSTVVATDTIILSQRSGTNKYDLLVTAVGSGSFEITFLTTGGTATDAPVINFAVIKAVTG